MTGMSIVCEENMARKKTVDGNGRHILTEAIGSLEDPFAKLSPRLLKSEAGMLAEKNSAKRRSRSFCTQLSPTTFLSIVRETACKHFVD